MRAGEPNGRFTLSLMFLNFFFSLPIMFMVLNAVDVCLIDRIELSNSLRRTPIRLSTFST